MQFGLRSGHPTDHALVSLTESIRSSLDNNRVALGIFIDLQKAFDTVTHDILLKNGTLWYQRNCLKLVYVLPE